MTDLVLTSEKVRVSLTDRPQIRLKADPTSLNGSGAGAPRHPLFANIKRLVHKPPVPGVAGLARLLRRVLVVSTVSRRTYFFQLSFGNRRIICAQSLFFFNFSPAG